MSRILVLSNGHGEDLSGSLLAKKLSDSGHQVAAIPLVGLGRDYKNQKIKIIGKSREFKTGGLGYTTIKGRLQDLLDGQIIYLVSKLYLLIRVQKKYDYLLVVGDIVPILFAWLIKKDFFVYLVAYSSHYEGKLKLPWPCGYFLKSSKIKKIYARDLLTSIDLTKQLKRKVIFLGNPFMDKFLNCKEHTRDKIFSIALLPGSRLPELENNFSLMLDTLERLSKKKFFESFEFNFALISAFERHRILSILQERNWSYLKSESSANTVFFEYQFIKVRFRWKAFEEILWNSKLAIAMAGTAAEQAIGLSKPLIQLEGSGPQFTKSFAEAQRRLLGENVYCATKFKNREHQVAETIKLILKVIYLIKLDNSFLLTCNKNAKKRLGEKFATQKIIKDINLSID